MIAPLLAPLGFGTWQAGSTLVPGFWQKEVVVSTMNIIYHAPDAAGLENQISQVFTPLSSISFMAFILLYIPCLATVGVIKKKQHLGNGPSSPWGILSFWRISYL